MYTIPIKQMGNIKKRKGSYYYEKKLEENHSIYSSSTYSSMHSGVSRGDKNSRDEISFAKEVADRVVYMESGVIVEEGTPKQMLEFPKNEKTIRFLRTLLNNSIEYNI